MKRMLWQWLRKRRLESIIPKWANMRIGKDKMLLTSIVIGWQNHLEYLLSK